MPVTIPLSLLTTSVEIALYTGTTGNGAPAFGAAAEARAHVEARRRLIVQPDGREAHSTMFAILPPGTAVTPESRLTYEGRTYRVLDVFPVPAPGGGIHHVEVALA